MKIVQEFFYTFPPPIFPHKRDSCFLVDTSLGRTVCAGQQSTTAIEVHDHYAARNGTWWLLCENVDRLKSVPITIASYLNSMSVVMIYGQTQAVKMASVNISVNVKPGSCKILYWTKSFKLNIAVWTCFTRQEPNFEE